MAEELKPNAKEILPIRQDLVVTAVGFLLNPSVKQRPDDAKIAFLKQKGLTDSEIDEAFNKVKYEVGTAIAPNGNSQLVNAYPLPPYQTHYPFWFYLKSYSSAFVSFAVAVYVLHRFYKSYIEPWLYGSKSEQSEISALKQQLKELNDSVSRLASSVASLEEAVTNQIHIERTSLYGVESVPKSVKDIQEEVSNVKSLLLNRFSFPAPPALAGSSIESKAQNGESKAAARVVTIPKWQLRDSEHGKSKVDSTEQLNECEDKEQSSTELSLDDSLSSTGDQTQALENDLKNANHKMQNEEAKTASEDKNANSSECLENNLSANGEIHNEDSKTAIENGVKNINDKTSSEDSGIESRNLSDSESADAINKRSGSTKKSDKKQKKK